MRKLLPTLLAGLSIPAALSSCSEVSGGPGSVDLSIQGQKAVGDFHGADYELRSNSAELLEDGSTLVVWTTTDLPGAPRRLAYVVLVQGLDWTGPTSGSHCASGEYKSVEQGLVADLDLAGGGLELSLRYAVDMVPPGPGEPAGEPAGAVVCEERLSGFFARDVNGIASLDFDPELDDPYRAEVVPLDLRKGRVFLVDLGAEQVAPDQFDLPLPDVTGGDLTAAEIHARLLGD